MWKTDSFEKTLMLRKIEGGRRGQQRIRWLDAITNLMDMSLRKLWVMVKLRYFAHLMWRTDWLEKTLMLGKIEGRRRRGQQRMRWMNNITDSWTWVWVHSRRWWRTGKPGTLLSMWSQRVRRDLVTEHQQIDLFNRYDYCGLHIIKY